MEDNNLENVSTTEEIAKNELEQYGLERLYFFLIIYHIPHLSLPSPNRDRCSNQLPHPLRDNRAHNTVAQGCSRQMQAFPYLP